MCHVVCVYESVCMHVCVMVCACVCVGLCVCSERECLCMSWYGFVCV